MRTVKILTISSLLLMLCCAQRDNRFDPQSPLYRVYPPQIVLSISFDSSKITLESDDTLRAFSPLAIDISVSALGGEDGSEQLPVLYYHYLDSNLIHQQANISEISTTLIESGLHKLEFVSSDHEGTTTVQQWFIQMVTPSVPLIRSFSSNQDTFAVQSTIELVLTTEIVDSFNLVEKICYELSPIKAIVHEITRDSSIVIYDTLKYQMSWPQDSSQTITLYVYDLLGRKDSMSVELFFDSDMNRGDSPNIWRVLADPCTAFVSEFIDFGVDAQDSDGYIIKYEWYFGDNYSAYVKEPFHRYMFPGNYNVKVKVEDDSGGVASDSISVTILAPDNIPPQITSLGISPDSGIAPLSVTFSAAAKDPDGFVEKYFWSFGDNNGIWTKTPGCSYVYKMPGLYEIRLIVRDNNWAYDTLTDTVRVTGGVIPELRAHPIPATVGSNIYFWLENSELDSANFIWYFPTDTFTTSYPNTYFNFLSPGDFRIKMNVNGDTVKEFEISIQVIQQQ